MIHTHAQKPFPLSGAHCPMCGRDAVDLHDGSYHCNSCGRVGMEPISLKHFAEVDPGSLGVAIHGEPRAGTNVRWACRAVPGCTHDTEAEANRHRRCH